MRGVGVACTVGRHGMDGVGIYREVWVWGRRRGVNVTAGMNASTTQKEGLCTQRQRDEEE